MMRALWTASTGMRSQQTNIDIISNNLSNVNTTAYKGQRAEFKDLLYVTMKENNRNEGVGRPVNVEVGHGVGIVATTRDFKTGGLMETQNNLDVAIKGDGFFSVEMPDGTTSYTRDGSFKISVEDGASYLVTSDGYYILNGEERIEIPADASDINIDETGLITVKTGEGEPTDSGRITLSNFINPSGLLSAGKNLYTETAASGVATAMDPENMKSSMIQGYLEASNVQVVDEMVKMITAQRAYEINSKAITTSDEMLQTANNLKR